MTNIHLSITFFLELTMFTTVNDKKTKISENKYKKSKQISISFITFDKKVLLYGFKVLSFTSLPEQTMWLIRKVSETILFFT